MKCKKMVALLAAAALALSIMAGCAKSGTESNGGIDLTKVNETVQAEGCEVRVTSSSKLRQAVEGAAALVGAYEEGEVSEGAVQHRMSQTLESFGRVVGISPRLVTEEQLKAGVESSWLGTIHTPEEIAAGIVLSMDQILKQVRYEAAAVQATTQDGVNVWVIAVIYYLNG